MDDSLGLLLARPSALRVGWLSQRGERAAVPIHVLPEAVGGRWLENAIAAIRQLAGPSDRALVVVAPPASADPGSVRLLVEAGAGDVIREDDPDGALLLHAALERHLRRAENVLALERGGMTGGSPGMRSARRRIAAALEDPDLPVLLQGETGTGKFLAASALHRADPRRRGAPFHSLDCGAVVEGLFGSELFGHVRGAFTGAQENRPGAIASAADGTLLLDEVGELPLSLQAAFLTALQERRYRRVGSDQAEPLRCRIIAATNRDLPAMVRDRQFRSDLFFRLDGVRVTLPPLRERSADVPDLFKALVARHAVADGTVPRVDDDVLDFLAHHPLPGNVRQLEMIARQAVRAAGRVPRIRVAHLPLDAASPDAGERPTDTPDIPSLVANGRRLDQILAACTESAVRAALALARRRLGPSRRTLLVRAAATALGVSERTVYYRLRDDAATSAPVVAGPATPAT